MFNDLITQLEQPDEATVLEALKKLEGQNLTAEQAVILGLLHERWRGTKLADHLAVSKYCFIPRAVDDSLEVQQSIWRLLEAVWPLDGLPDSLEKFLDLCHLFAQHVYLSIFTHGEHRYAEPNRTALAIYPSYQIIFEKALRLSVLFQQEFILLAQIFWSYHRLAEAGLFLPKALRLLPKQAIHYHDWVSEMDSALPLHEGLQPHNSWTWFYWAEYQRYSAEDLEKALEAYQYYLQLEPAFVPWANFRTQESYVCWRNLPPSSLQAWAEIGYIYEVWGQYQRAEEAYQQAIDLAQKSQKQTGFISQQTPYLALAKLLERQDRNPDEAYQALWAVCKQHGHKQDDYLQYISLEARLELGYWLCRKAKTLWQVQHKKEALQWCKQALEQTKANLGDLSWFGIQTFQSEEDLKFKWLGHLTTNALPQLRVRREAIAFDRAAHPEIVARHQEQVLELQLLQAEIVMEGYRDYWQARILYQKIAEHPEAKKQLEAIRKKLGY